MLYIAWCLIGIMVLLISICLTSILSSEMRILLILIVIGLFFLLINVKIIEYISSDHFIVIKKNYLLRQTVGKEKLIEVPIHQLKDYSVKERFLCYELVLVVESEKAKKMIKINCIGFTWKLMVRMIKSLENVTKSNQQETII